MRLLNSDKIMAMAKLFKVNRPIGALPLIDVPVKQGDSFGIKCTNMIKTAIAAVR